jgi:Uma2 family endonuclease
VIAEIYSLFTGRSEKGITSALRGLEERHSDEELRVVVAGVSWKDYLRIDEARGEDCGVPKLYWHDNQLEIMSTSLNHEELKKWIASLLEDFLLWMEIEYFPHGSATMQKLKRAGAEPDDSWCFKTQKEFPDLVLEVALTSGGLPKLEVYRHFAVPEVWMWRKDGIEVWTLKRDKSAYDGPAKRSRLLSKLDIPLLERCLTKRTCSEARRAFGKGLAGKS